MLYTTIDPNPVGVVVDRSDVDGAIETPSGELRAPRLRRPIADVATSCEAWLTRKIPNFQPINIDPLEVSLDSETALDPYFLASKVVSDVSSAGSRARIEAKRDTWSDFGVQEARHLTEILELAQQGQLSEEVYRSQLNEIVESAA